MKAYWIDGLLDHVPIRGGVHSTVDVDPYDVRKGRFCGSAVLRLRSTVPHRRTDQPMDWFCNSNNRRIPFERLSAARGVTVPETAPQRDWVHAFARRHG